jgi:hypothetical protein
MCFEGYMVLSKLRRVPCLALVESVILDFGPFLCNLETHLIIEFRAWAVLPGL